MKTTYTSQKAIRKSFWDAHPRLERHARMWGIKTAPQNRHNLETRTAFVEWVDMLAKNDEITEKLAFRATL